MKPLEGWRLCSLLLLLPGACAYAAWPRGHTSGLTIRAEARPPFNSAPSRKGYEVQDEFVLPAAVAKDTPLPAALVMSHGTRFPTMTQARKACRKGHVLVNGRESRCIHLVSAGDVVSLQLRVQPGYTPRGLPPFPVQVVWEDDHLAVVVKPAGVVAHPPPGGASGSRSMRTAVAHGLRPPAPGTPSALFRPHLCHRLDKPTYGLLLCAKTKDALVGAQRAFAQRRVHKRYTAVVCGRVEAEAGEIERDIDGRPARTEWRVVRRCRSLRLGGGHLTMLALYPRTGRTHQLRRHCSEVLRTPIVGDAQYGGKDGGCGLLLAALELELDHPCKEMHRLHFQIEPPPKFDALMSREHSRWERLGDASSLPQNSPAICDAPQ
ncbi:hypothetical protein AB1Y20_001452 [Prymnesium parvum]|uniref:Pseudouridine synthase RsuA/RluA-like domain-containing protein n=1 Tax=Prymnesium parvum TaxID=97485 RepID=A0AB34KCL5_PRYPA